MYKVLAIRKKNYQPIIDARSNEMIDSGEPKQIQLWENESKDLVKNFAENVKNSVKSSQWKIWIEEIKK